MKPGDKITLNRRCFKIDIINAGGMIEGFEKNGGIFNTSIWCDVKLRPFPMLITLNRGQTPYKGSFLAKEINPEDYKYKYIAVYDSQYFIKNDLDLWEVVCNNGLFDIWAPDDPYKRFADPKICKSPPSTFRIILLRIWEIEEEIKKEKIIPRSNYVHEISRDSLNVTLKHPIINDKKFEEIRDLLKDSIKNYQNQPIREKFFQRSPVERDPNYSYNKHPTLSERNFENIIIERLEDIEKGLSLIKRQFSVDPVGRIDLLCEDKNKDLVVIELKKFGVANYSIIDQIARYMGWIKEHKAKQGQRVRGIIIVGKTDEKLEYAAKAIPNLQVKSYTFSID